MRIYYPILLLILITATPLYAQVNPGIDSNTGLPVGIEEQVSKRILPSIPKPGEQVNLSINSFSTNIDKANISWYVNGSLKEQGLGIKSINILAPRVGNVTNVEVVIGKEDGGTLRENFTIAPAEVDILYEAFTYVPPFYKGRALFTNQSVIKFVAEPNFITQSGTRISPDNLVYNWKIDNQIINEASGAGKKSFTYLGQLIQRDMVVSVDITSKSSNLKARGDILIKQKKPLVYIYEKNPLFGLMFEQAVNGKFELLRDEVEFKAIPYFFSVGSGVDNNLSYNWVMNGRNIGISRLKDTMIFRNENDKSGTANINLKVEHLKKILQGAQTDTSINFQPRGLQDFDF